MNLRMVDLFSGIGGISLGAEMTGEIETVAFCEIEPFPQKILRKHWPSVPIFDDVKTLTRQTLIDRGVIDDERPIDIICGGYPCQPFSTAGKREGEEDDRHLWPEVKRLLQEINPKWFVGENVAGHITLGLDLVLSDLESIDYTWETFVIPAASVGANHERYRTFIIAHSNNIENAWDSNSKPELQTNSKIIPIGSKGRTRESITGEYRGSVPRNHWRVHKPPVCGVDDGIPRGLDQSRLVSLGNAVVPQQCYPIFKAIVEIERRAIS